MGNSSCGHAQVGRRLKPCLALCLACRVCPAGRDCTAGRGCNMDKLCGARACSRIVGRCRREEGLRHLAGARGPVCQAVEGGMPVQLLNAALRAYVCAPTWAAHFVNHIGCCNLPLVHWSVYDIGSQQKASAQRALARAFALLAAVHSCRSVPRANTVGWRLQMVCNVCSTHSGLMQRMMPHAAPAATLCFDPRR